MDVLYFGLYSLGSLEYAYLRPSGNVASAASQVKHSYDSSLAQKKIVLGDKKRSWKIQPSEERFLQKIPILIVVFLRSVDKYIILLTSE
jgi:hypothetical protein